jgi:hypothetical protein
VTVARPFPGFRWNLSGAARAESEQPRKPAKDREKVCRRVSASAANFRGKLK